MTRHRLSIDDEISKRAERQARRLGEPLAWVLEEAYRIAEARLDAIPAAKSKAGCSAWFKRYVGKLQERKPRKAKSVDP